MVHDHIVINTDSCFEIDPITRVITQTSGKKKLVQGDHNSERYGFKLARENDGHDMSLCNSVRVNYINVGSGSDRSNGIYDVEDLHVDKTDDKFVTFTWLVSRNSTKFAGTLNFNISFRCLSGSKVVYEWNTDIYKGIGVTNGINNGDEFVENEEYIDILEQWRQEILSTVGTADGTVTSVNGVEPDENGNVTLDIPTDEDIERLINESVTGSDEVLSYLIDEGFIEPALVNNETIYTGHNGIIYVL